jgi:hypothetical protein
MSDDTVSLRQYLEARLSAHDELHRAHEAAHEREHKATEMAISKAEIATNNALIKTDEVVTARFTAQNEWRAAMLDRERQFLNRSEYEAMRARVDSLDIAETRRSEREQIRERAQIRAMSLIGVAAAVGGFLLSLVVRLLGVGA